MRKTNLKKVLSFTLILLLSTFDITALAQKTNEATKPDLKISIQEDPKNELSLTFAAIKIEEAREYQNNGNFIESERILKEISKWLKDSAEYHFDLYEKLNSNLKTLSISKIERAYAHDFAKLRDKSYFYLAKIYIKQKKVKKAIPLYIEIIKSQPDSKLGLKSYRMLKVLKFVD